MSDCSKYRQKQPQDEPNANIPRSFEDPFEIHEKIRKNMLLYVDPDTQQVDSENLAARLQNEINNGKPADEKPE